MVFEHILCVLVRVYYIAFTIKWKLLCLSFHQSDLSTNCSYFVYTTFVSDIFSFALKTEKQPVDSIVIDGIKNWTACMSYVAGWLTRDKFVCWSLFFNCLQIIQCCNKCLGVETIWETFDKVNRLGRGRICWDCYFVFPAQLCFFPVHSGIWTTLEVQGTSGGSNTKYLFIYVPCWWIFLHCSWSRVWERVIEFRTGWRCKGP